jgi:prephenate dehydrogenase
MSPEDHDRTLALTSHLPHLVASALAGLLHPGLTGMAASGFRDTTRLAAGDPGLWTGIFLQNAPHLLTAMKCLESRLKEFRKAIAADDAVTVQRLLTDAKGIRDDLGS